MSLVERLSLSQRVLYRRFHCIPNKNYSVYVYDSNLSFPLTAVILEFVQQSYTFREDSSTNNAVIGVTIGNYDELVIKNDIRFTVSRISGNATNPEGN